MQRIANTYIVNVMKSLSDIRNTIKGLGVYARPQDLSAVYGYAEWNTAIFSNILYWVEQTPDLYGTSQIMYAQRVYNPSWVDDTDMGATDQYRALPTLSTPTITHLGNSFYRITATAHNTPIDAPLYAYVGTVAHPMTLVNGIWQVDLPITPTGLQSIKVRSYRPLKTEIKNLSATVTTVQ